jgi:hypothetical protein
MVAKTTFALCFLFLYLFWFWLLPEVLADVRESYWTLAEVSGSVKGSVSGTSFCK